MRYGNGLLLTTIAAFFLAATPHHQDVPQLLQRQTQELLNAITSGSAAVWERYLDDAVQVTAEDGKLSGKAEMVKDIRPLAAGVSGRIDVTDFHATVHGSVAVTTYISDEHESYHGQQLHCQYRTTDTWLQRDGQWRLIASQVLALKTDPPAVPLSDAQLASYAGKYLLGDGITYEIRVANGKLEGQRNGRAAEPLLAEAADVLFVPGSPRYRKLFHRDGDGRVTGFAERREAWDLTWTRIE